MAFVGALLAAKVAVALELRADSIEAAEARFSTVVLHVDPAPLGRLALRLDIAEAEVPTLGVQHQPLSVRCELARDEARWRCRGTLQWGARAAPGKSMDLNASFDANSMDLDVRGGEFRATISSEPPLPGKWRVVVKDLPLAWLNAALVAQWPAAKLGSGTLDADAKLGTLPDGIDAHGHYALHDLSLDTEDGRIAAAHVTAEGSLALHAPHSRLSIENDGTLKGGEILVGPFYAKLPSSPVSLSWSASQAGKTAWDISRFQVDDAQVLHIEASASIDPTQAEPLLTWSVGRVDLVLPLAYTRYGQAMLAPRSLGELTTQGTLKGSARLDERGIRAFAVQAENVGIDDAQRRVSVHGLNGGIDWRRDEVAPGTSLAWQAMELYRLPFDAAKWNWRSVDGVLALQDTTSLPLLGGAVDILQFSLSPAAQRGDRLHASIAMHDIDMRRFSGALGWPEFGGVLGGGVPVLRYRDERLEIGGGLMLNVFDGTVNVTDLSIERPFGVAPVLTTDIAFSNLDLKLLTGTFDFGEISGRLSGAIKALRLLGWSPVAFDAELHALEGGKISQRAVNNLSSVGGGIGAGLQASLMRVFDSFGYSRLGLHCRLENNVCHMGGLDSAGQGYSIVEGRGLPRITIVGHQGEVDWPVLVERLKAATSGTAPVIR